MQEIANKLLNEVCRIDVNNKATILDLISRVDATELECAQIIYFTVESLIDLSLKEQNFPIMTQEIVNVILKTNPSLLPVIATDNLKKYWPEFLVGSLEQYKKIEKDEVKEEQ